MNGGINEDGGFVELRASDLPRACCCTLEAAFSFLGLPISSLDVGLQYCILN